jgi:hypothetical protein
MDFFLLAGSDREFVEVGLDSRYLVVLAALITLYIDI